MGPNGESIDRIYGSPASGGQLRLINADYSDYKGKIFKKTIILKGIDGNNFKSLAYLTEDGRWFDRAGMPVSAPSNVEQEETETE